MSRHIQKNFGIKIKEMRKDKGFTQEKLAEMINISPRHMSRIETGENFPKPEIIERLSFYLEADLKSLFDFPPQIDNAQISTGTNGTQILSVSIKKDVIDISTKTVRIPNQFEEAEKRKLQTKITQKLKENNYNKNELEFLLTAAEAIENPGKLDELNMIIKGMQMARK